MPNTMPITALSTIDSVMSTNVFFRPFHINVETGCDFPIE